MSKKKDKIFYISFFKRLGTLFLTKNTWRIKIVFRINWRIKEKMFLELIEKLNNN